MKACKTVSTWFFAGAEDALAVTATVAASTMSGNITFVIVGMGVIDITISKFTVSRAKTFGSHPVCDASGGRKRDRNV